MSRKAGKATDRHRNVAKAVISGRSTIREAMEANGFSQTYARAGLPSLHRNSVPFREAIDDELRARMSEADKADLPVPGMKKLVLHRLALNVARGKDEGVHSARALGSIKELDMFVRTNDVQVGIFAALSDPASKESQLLDGLTAALHLCGWCNESHNTFDELASHMTSCPKNPAPLAKTMTVEPAIMAQLQSQGTPKAQKESEG